MLLFCNRARVHSCRKESQMNLGFSPCGAAEGAWAFRPLKPSPPPCHPENPHVWGPNRTAGDWGQRGEGSAFRFFHARPSHDFGCKSPILPKSGLCSWGQSSGVVSRRICMQERSSFDTPTRSLGASRHPGTNLPSTSNAISHSPRTLRCPEDDLIATQPLSLMDLKSVSSRSWRHFPFSAMHL